GVDVSRSLRGLSLTAVRARTLVAAATRACLRDGHVAKIPRAGRAARRRVARLSDAAPRDAPRSSRGTPGRGMWGVATGGALVRTRGRLRPEWRLRGVCAPPRRPEHAPAARTPRAASRGLHNDARARSARADARARRPHPRRPPL